MDYVKDYEKEKKIEFVKCFLWEIKIELLMYNPRVVNLEFYPSWITRFPHVYSFARLDLKSQFVG